MPGRTTTIDITEELASKIIKSTTIFWEMCEITTLVPEEEQTTSGDINTKYERYGIFRRTTDGTYWSLRWVDDPEEGDVTVRSNDNRLVTLRRVRQIVTTTWEEI